MQYENICQKAKQGIIRAARAVKYNTYRNVTPLHLVKGVFMCMCC